MENQLVALKGNTPALWALFEEHSEHDTVAVPLGKGRYVMRCTEHNTNHVIAENKKEISK